MPQKLRILRGIAAERRSKGACRIIAGKINGMIGVGHQERVLCDYSRIIMHTVFVLKFDFDTTYLPSNKIPPPPSP